MTPVVVTAVGAGDCEAVRSGLLAQPSNAISSLGFVVAGLWLAVRGARAFRSRGWAFVLVGLGEIATGLSSFVYHGPAGPLAPFVHDLGLAVFPLAVVAVDAAGPGRAGRRRAPWLLGLLLAAVAAVLAVWSAGAVVTAVSVTAAGTAEVLAWRRGRRGPLPAYRPAALVAALGLTVYVLGRTGGPLCRPASLLQAHAAWHVLIAAAATLYLDRALAQGPRADTMGGDLPGDVPEP